MSERGRLSAPGGPEGATGVLDGTAARLPDATMSARHPAADCFSAYRHSTVTAGQMWICGAAWAVLTVPARFFMFWEAEARYGRG